MSPEEEVAIRIEAAHAVDDILLFYGIMCPKKMPNLNN
jgi:hypothetical protein